MQVTATLTEIRADGKQKWERTDLPVRDHMCYIWLNPYQSIKGVEVGSYAKLEFNKGTGGMISGHFSIWKVKELLNNKPQERICSKF